MREVKRALGRPDNSMFIRRLLIYAVVLAVMIFLAPTIFQAIMAPMAADGMKGAWYGVFIPATAVLMAIGLFRCWRRRWSLAFFDWYRKEAAECNYEACPRCGSPMEVRQRTRSSRAKVGEVVTTTTYSDGSKTVDSEDVYGTVSNTNTYHVCTNSSCKLEPEQHVDQSHLPWKVKEIRCLVLEDGRALRGNKTCAKDLLLSRLLAPILALVFVAVGAFFVYDYASGMSGEWTHTTADKEAARTMDEYKEYLLTLDTEHASWFMYYKKEPADMMSYLGERLGQESNVGYSIERYGKDDQTVLIYSFEGEDAGTGLPDGEYVLIKLDGVDVLIDDENELIYKQGTEAYDTYAPKLLALTHDVAVSALFEKVDGGEHALSGSNDFWMEFARKDNTMIYSYMLAEDESKINGGEFRAITTHPDEIVTEKWTFSYRDSDYVYTPDVEGFEYSETLPIENDD